MDRDEFIEWLDETEVEDILNFFGSDIAFFNFIKKHKLEKNVDLTSDKLENRYILWCMENNPEEFKRICETRLGDVEFDEKGKVYLVRHNRSDLAVLFCDNRRDDLSIDTIEKILGNDSDFYEPYWETTDDVYRDVIDELDKENIERLKKYILKELDGQKLSPETEEMELIASEQGHDDYWVIDSRNVARIIDNEDSMKSLLGDELSDLKMELYSIHSNAYNSAYEEEIYDKIFSELNREFEGKGQFISKPHPFKPNTSVELFKIPIIDFEGLMRDFLDAHKDGGYYSSVDYFGSFLEILKEMRDCLSTRVPDYPDFRKVDKNINSYFLDFI